jgi:CubicO group peptidase (beta-lactamase class C family)
MLPIVAAAQGVDVRPASAVSASKRHARGPIFLFLACAAGCVADENRKIAYNDVPARLDDGWAISTPAAEGFDPTILRAAYQDFFAEDQYLSARSLLVVRHGKLVAEGYCRDMADRAQLRNTQSTTKSITSLLFGIALDQGRFPATSANVYDFVPDKFDGDATRRRIKLQDLLTMRSGIDLTDGAFSAEPVDKMDRDSLAFILHRPMIREPGTDFVDEDVNTHLLGGVIQRVVGAPLQDFARAHLFGPLGIDNFFWDAHIDGVDFGASGLSLRPRDMAKLGQLCLQGGAYDGAQVVSQTWVAESTDTHTDTPRTAIDRISYGYSWWWLSNLNAVSSWG